MAESDFVLHGLTHMGCILDDSHLAGVPGKILELPEKK